MPVPIPREKVNALIEKVNTAITNGSIKLEEIITVFPDIPSNVISSIGERNQLDYQNNVFFNRGDVKTINFTLESTPHQIIIPEEIECRYNRTDNGFILEFTDQKRLKFGKMVRILFLNTWVWCHLLKLEVSMNEIFIDMDLDPADRRIPVA
ncbi:MAG: hypothetical protein AB2L14_11850 [Candidatus Xenobiia bacterium LiM19]